MPFRLRARARHTRLRRHSSGQALVEFALVAPIFFAMFFGIVEFAFILTTISGYNFATREAARKGSIEGRTTLTVDSDILAMITGRAGALPFAKAISVDIYRATPSGLCTTVATDDPTTTINITPPGTAGCIEDQYSWNGTAWASTGWTPAWPPAQRNDSLLGADYVGVHILYQYTFVTGFVPNNGSLPLGATSVQRIEPQEYGAWIVPPLPPALAAMATTARAPTHTSASMGNERRKGAAL